MSQDTGKSCYRDYVIRDGVFIGKFEEMYTDITDPWGCVEKVGILKNRLLLELLKEFGHQERVLDVGCGLGSLTARICEITKPKRIDAFDVSKTAIKKARQYQKQIFSSTTCLSPHFCHSMMIHSQ